MKLKLVKTLWGVDGVEDPEKWDAIFAKIKAEGFEAIEAITLAWRTDKEKFCSLLEKHGLSLICQIHTTGGDIDKATGEYQYCTSNKLHEHLASFTRLVSECAGLPLKPILINSHSGHDSWGSGEKAVAFLKKAITIEQALGVPVVHETHRQRLLSSPYAAAELLGMPELEKLKINADLSHWCCVCEHVFDGTSKRDDWWPATLALVAKHCEFIHCRVGHAQGPQVPDPDAPEYAAEVGAHFAWWRAIWSAQAERHSEAEAHVWAEPEFGPPPYLQCAPFTKVPVANLWEVNKKMAARMREEFDKAMASPEAWDPSKPGAGGAVDEYGRPIGGGAVDEYGRPIGGAAPAHWRQNARADTVKAEMDAYLGKFKAPRPSDIPGEGGGGSDDGHGQGLGPAMLKLALEKEKAHEAAKQSAAAKAAAKEQEKLAKEYAKLQKACIKEGGKKGVEIEGASDMGGLEFFCTSLEMPDGNIELLELSMTAMNAQPDPEAEERKGCSGAVGKMIFSAGVEQLALIAYVPETKKDKVDVTEWVTSVLESVGGIVMMKPAEPANSPDGGLTVQAVIKGDADNGRFPLKDKDLAMAAAFAFLRSKGAFPDDDGGDDSDEMIVRAAAPRILAAKHAACDATPRPPRPPRLFPALASLTITHRSHIRAPSQFGDDDNLDDYE